MQAERTFIVPNKEGVHARPAAQIVRVANKYPECNLTVENGNGVRANAKSIISVMMLAAGKGAILKFFADGENVECLLSDIEALFKNNIGEKNEK